MIRNLFWLEGCGWKQHISLKKPLPPEAIPRYSRFGVGTYNPRASTRLVLNDDPETTPELEVFDAQMQRALGLVPWNYNDT